MMTRIYAIQAASDDMHIVQYGVVAVPSSTHSKFGNTALGLDQARELVESLAS